MAAETSGVATGPTVQSPKPVAAIYLRGSDKRITIENQFRACWTDAVKDGFQIPFIRIYADVEKGDSPLDVRWGFNQLLRDARARQFDSLYVFALDRLTRGGPMWAIFLNHLFETIGIQWVSVKEPHLTESEAEDRELYLALEGWRARKEKRRLSERNKAAVQTRKAKGGLVGRVPGAKDKSPRKRARQRRPDSEIIRHLLGQGTPR